MSADELRARIVQLDSEIQRQKKLLKKLEEDMILDLRLASSTLLSMRWHASPSKFRRISCNHQLRVPAESSHTGPLDNRSHSISLWRRFGRRPADLVSAGEESAIGYKNWNNRVSDVLWSHSGQFKHLEILDDDGLVPDGNRRAIDFFGETPPVSLPLLQTLAIRCQYDVRKYRTSQIFQLLREAPNIVEFISDKVWTGNNPSPEGLVIVPTLRRVFFGGTSGGDDEIFLRLALPALEALSLPMRYVSGDDLVASIERLAAPLCDLALGWQFPGIQSLHLHKCLRLIPTVTRFTMWKPDADVVMELFDALAKFPSLLPNLHDLTIHIFYTLVNSHIPDSSWRTLIRALSTRRLEQLYIVPVKASPPPDVLASLRELVASGAKMHVGTRERDFVAA
ncbi:hypothetical protein C8R45DRAFT_934253 [Mycena sanguinolenta]|nr:hypothetical protein C8R45DRAFT_934253 [Mycena sanguinolenta]